MSTSSNGVEDSAAPIRAGFERAYTRGEVGTAATRRREAVTRISAAKRNECRSRLLFSIVRGAAAEV
jgi:hypothetical protein